MRVLVLGGNKFLGRAFVDSLLAAGHGVTTFNRGLSGHDDPRVEALHGDLARPGDLEGRTEGRAWDAVVDTAAQVPRDLARVVDVLSPRARAYLLVSSVSAHAGFGEETLTEDSPLHASRGDLGARDGHYGQLKAGCELALRRFPGAAFVLRPGLITGPGEEVGRLPWWLLRLRDRARPRIVVPGAYGDKVQLVDARDIADFGVLLLERAPVSGGTRHTEPEAYLVAGPASHHRLGHLLEIAAESVGVPFDPVWVPHEELLREGLEPWSQPPLWAPPELMPHAWDVRTDRARAAGFATRSLAGTVRETWAWWEGELAAGRSADPGQFEVGIPPEAEARILARHRRAEGIPGAP